jgi:hypothetical protein
MLKFLQVIFLTTLLSAGFLKAHSHTHAENPLPALHHVVIFVSPEMFKKEADFYKKSLAVAGITVTMENENSVMFGRKGAIEFIVSKSGASVAGNAKREPTTPIHFSFLGADTKAVNDWYNAALKAGGKDNGKPGAREAYGPMYYGAFVISPAGHNTEMVSASGPMIKK